MNLDNIREKLSQDKDFKKKYLGELSDSGQESAFVAAKKDPEKTARALELSKKTGIDVETVEKNSDSVAKDYEDTALVKFMNGSKSFTASWMKSDPNNAAVTKDDTENLGIIEQSLNSMKEGLSKIFASPNTKEGKEYVKNLGNYGERQQKRVVNQFKQGQQVVETSHVGWDAIWKGLTPERKKQIDEIRAKQQKLTEEGEDPMITGWVESIPGYVANQIPIMGQTISGGIEFGGPAAIFGAGAGAAVGAVAGATAPVPGGAAGGAGIGAKLGARLAGGYGAKMGMAYEAMKLESANAYADYISEPDNNGNPISHEDARAAALIAGSLAGSLEFVGLSAVAKNIPGLRRLQKDGIKELLKSQSGREVLKTYTKNIFKSGLTEGSTEFAQSMITSVGGEILKMHNEGTLTTASPEAHMARLFSEDKFLNAWEEAKAGAGSAVGMGIGGSVITARNDIKKAEAAQTSAQALKDLKRGVENSKSMKRSPEKVKELINKMSNNNNLDTVYVPQDKFDQYFQDDSEKTGNIIDPAKVAERAGIKKQYDDAKSTGTDIAIPTENFAEMLGAGHGDFLVNEAKTSPDAMNNREAQEWFKEQSEKQKHIEENDEAKSKAKLDISGKVQKILEDAGQLPDNAEKMADVVSDFFVTQGINSNINPVELFDSYGITIDGVNQVAQQEQYQPGFEYIDMIREGITKIDESNAEDLMQYIRRTGGISTADAADLKSIMDKGAFSVLRGKKGKSKPRGLDQAAIAAFEAGYIPNSEVGTFLDAVSKAASGELVLPVGNQDQSTRQIELDKMIDAIKSIGVTQDDLSQITNEQLLNALNNQERLTGLSQELGARGIQVRVSDLVKLKDAKLNDIQQMLESPLYESENARIKAMESFLERAGYEKQIFDPFREMTDKEISRTFEQNDRANISNLGFFSKIEQTVIDKMGGAASPKEIMAWLKEVKPEEIKWSGIEEFLKGKKKVSKEELLAFVRANQLEIKEVTKGNKYSNEQAKRQERLVSAEAAVIEQARKQGIHDPRDYALDAANNALSEGQMNNMSDEMRPLVNELSAAYEARQSGDYEEAASVKTKFDNYTLPGGENYREVLFALPVSESDKFDPKKMEIKRDRRSTTQGSYSVVYDGQEFGPFADQITNDNGQWEGLSDDIITKTFKHRFERGAYSMQGKVDKSYRSSHFDEANVIAHTRLNDRIDSDGKKVLFVEEIQSDWHQEGRKKGYKGDESDAEASLIREMVSAKIPEGIHSAQVTMSANYGSEAWNADVPQSLKDAANNFKMVSTSNKKGVPDAPFKKTWHEFVLKRIIRMAAEQGYDRVSWTKGSTQSERYSLSKQVDSVGAFKNKDGSFNIEALKDGSIVSEQDNVKPESLDALMGKDLANKIRNEEGESEESGYRTYKGVDLEVGGEGMKGFYDKILVDFANKFGKKFNTKVESSNVETTDGTAPVHSLPITPELKKVALESGFSLFQKDGFDSEANPNGSITFRKGKTSINLNLTANLTTPLHEFSHLFLEVMADLADAANAPQKVKDDFNGVLKWMGISDRSQIKREHHEMFADTFEAYLREGKAPTASLQSAFNAFRGWLVTVYGLIQNIRGAKISPEIRDIFDRMIATEEEIVAAQQEMEIFPMFNDLMEIGMGENAAKAYSETIREARDAPMEELLARQFREIEREKTKWWAEEREKIRAQMAESFDERPDVIASSHLKYGKTPSGEQIENPVKISKGSIVERYSKDFLRTLPRPYIYSVKDGKHLDDVAQFFNFNSADELIYNIKNTPNREEFLDAASEAEMKRLHGDILSDGSIYELAEQAVMNDKQEKLMRMELQHLMSQEFATFKGLTKRLSSPVPTTKQFKARAQEHLRNLKIIETRPDVYKRAANKYSKKSIDLLLKGDFQGSIEAKKQQMFNHHLYNESVLLKDFSEKSVKWARRFKKESKRRQLGRTDFLDQIDNQLEKYEFVYVSAPKLEERRLGLVEWAEEQRKNGVPGFEDFDIDAMSADSQIRRNYRELTNGEFAGVIDTLKQIDHLAIQSDKVLTQEKKIRRQEMIDELKSAVIANIKDRTNKNPWEVKRTEGQKGLVDRAKENLRLFDSSMVAPYMLFEWLDGGAPDGPFSRYIAITKDDASNAEFDMNKDITARIALLTENLPKEIKEKFNDTITVSGVNKTFTREMAIVTFLNAGTQSNLDKMMKGEQLSEQNVNDIINTLTKAELDFAQGMLNILDGLWEPTAKLHKEMTGLPPNELERRKIVTIHGEYIGGYYPMMYDRSQSVQGEIQVSEQIGKLTSKGYTKATTDTSRTKDRDARFSAPIDYNLSRLTSHISATVKDITHRKWIHDMNFILSDNDLKQLMNNTLGGEYYTLILDWANRTVNSANNGTMEKSMGLWDRMFRKIRSNTTLVLLGYRFSVIFSQFAGVAPAIQIIGGKERDGKEWMAKGLTRAVRNPRMEYNWVTGKSGMMRRRLENKDRDMREAIEKIRGDKDFLSDAKIFGMHGIAVAELLITVPAWIGAYEKSMSMGFSDRESILYADNAVTNSQGSGEIERMTAVQSTKNEFMKMLTMFYTPFAALYNQLRNIYRSTDGVKDAPYFASSMIWALVVPAVLGELFAGRGPGEPEDEDEWLNHWTKWAMGESAMYAIASLPIGRDLVNFAFDSKFGYKLSPVASAYESGGKLMKTTVALSSKMLDEDEEITQDDLEKLFKETAKVWSFATGVSTRQLEISAGYLLDINEGKEEPEDVVEFVHKLLYARPKKK